MKPTETSERLCDSVLRLMRMDLGKLFASGIDVTVHNYTAGNPDHTDRFTLAAEGFGPVRVALLEALQKTLERRRESLRRELEMVEKIAGTK